MSFRHTPTALAAVVALALTGCGTAVATSDPIPAAPPMVAHAIHVSAPVRAVDGFTAMAERQYVRETGGAVARADLRRVASDPGLRRAARSGDLATLRAYVNGRFTAVWYHEHVSRLQILRGQKVVVDAGVPFVVNGPGTRLPGHYTLRISIQDEIGFVRLLHRHNPIELVVRGQSAAHVRSSLPAATNVVLPRSGQVTVAGRRYDVRSFTAQALGREPVTIWILKRA